LDALERLLAEPDLREHARRALERVPGEAAGALLLRAAKSADGEWRDALLVSAGTKRCAKCLAELARIAESGGPGSAAAAMALARIGDPAAIPAILGAIRRAEPSVRAKLADDLLRMGDGLAAGGDAEIARRIYQSVLAHAEDDGPRAAALAALAASDAQRSLGILAEALGDPSERVRDLALELLERLGSAEADRALLDRFERAEGPARASLLRVLAKRRVAGVERWIQEALRSDDVDLRVTALELDGKLSDPANETALLEAFEKGSPAVRVAAFRAYLDLADAAAVSDAAKAERMYLKAFRESRDARDRSRALVGLGASGNAAHLELVEAARKDPELAASANEACVALALALGRRGEKDRAVDLLLSVVSSGASRETVQKALASLKDLGGDPTLFQKKQGFISSWYVVGPFPNEGGKGFAAAYSPEEAVDLEAQVDARGRKRRWAEFHSTSLDGKVDLRQVFQRTTDVCAYAYAEIEAPRAMPVTLKMGSDDGVVCWVNGKKVHANDATRPLAIDSDVVEGVQLARGRNTILLKVTQGGGEWEFSFRIVGEDGRPIDLSGWPSLLGPR
ncbi:MAG: HEAT repeat domain-containing protein, partial [Planctomycetota bacterium]